MRKSKSFFMLFALAALFLVASVAFAISETLANENNAPAESTGNYAEGKVIPPGWCLEHGYIGLQDTGEPLVCIRCS